MLTKSVVVIDANEIMINYDNEENQLDLIQNKERKKTIRIAHLYSDEEKKKFYFSFLPQHQEKFEKEREKKGDQER